MSLKVFLTTSECSLPSWCMFHTHLPRDSQRDRKETLSQAATVRYHSETAPAAGIQCYPFPTPGNALKIGSDTEGQKMTARKHFRK